MKLVICSFAALALSAAGLSYQDSVEHWRLDRQAKLTRDFGWLTVVGLDWLKEGDNRVGADSSSADHQSRSRFRPVQPQSASQ